MTLASAVTVSGRRIALVLEGIPERDRGNWNAVLYISEKGRPGVLKVSTALAYASATTRQIVDGARPREDCVRDGIRRFQDEAAERGWLNVEIRVKS